ncbi:hypothetical protein SeLEV6574_g02740 [Synchytrium endobioticum]|nr:hypothetical protein SeLEV6574_g02740 [Synchytrium endobioticum]
MTQVPEPLRYPAELLSRVHVNPMLLCRNKSPVYIDATATVEEAASILTNNNISSAPLYDAPSDNFIGVLDYRDLATYVLKVFHKASSENKFNVEAEMGMSDIVKLSNFDKQGVPVHLIANLSRRDALVPIEVSATLSDACSLLVKEKVHRLIVFDPAIPKGPERFLGVLSESSVCKFVADRFGKLGEVLGTWDDGKKSLAELGFVKGNVISIHKEDSVLDALSIMHDHSISSLAIIENGDKLIGTISMSDIREILKSRRDWKHLYDQVFTFFQNNLSRLGIERGADRVPSVVARPQTSLLTAMERMVGTHIHRLWIVENGDTLVGVLAMSDLMPLFLSRMPQEK